MQFHAASVQASYAVTRNVATFAEHGTLGLAYNLPCDRLLARVVVPWRHQIYNMLARSKEIARFVRLKWISPNIASQPG